MASSSSVGLHIVGEWRHDQKTEQTTSALIARPPVSYENLPQDATVSLLDELSEVLNRLRVVLCADSRLALALDHVDNGDKIA